MRDFQNPVAAVVSRLKHSESQSELTFAATVLQEPRMTRNILIRG
jgi:hypothetical protein